eukprot:11175873-Heterocapsa_arctica.AAC.1
MIRVLNWVMKQARKSEEMKGLVDFAFEWPRGSSGWDIEAIIDMRRALCYTGKFDGCMYGLQDAHGNAVRKPWRVVTTSQDLADALTRRCDQ